MDTPWRIQIYGGLRAQCGKRVVEHFYSQKATALLAYLAFHRGQSHSREVLAELLWPGAEPEVGLCPRLIGLRRCLVLDHGARPCAEREPR